MVAATVPDTPGIGKGVVNAEFLRLLNLTTEVVTAALSPPSQKVPIGAQALDLVCRLGELEDVVRSCGDYAREYLKVAANNNDEQLERAGQDDRAGNSTVERHPGIKSAPSSVVTVVPPALDLPPAAIARIFEHATIPKFFLNATQASVPKSFWVQTLQLIRRLSLVSKSWNQVGAQFMYNHVCVWRVEQLPLLVRSLITNPTNRAFVKSFTFVAFVDPWCEYHAFASLATIFSACYNLKSFNFAPLWPLPDGMVLPPLPAHIEELHSGRFIAPDWFIKTLEESAGHLRSLTLSPTFDLPTKNLEFAELQELTLNLSNVPASRLQDIQGRWSFPSLRSVTLHGMAVLKVVPDKEPDETWVSLTRLCQAIGPNVRYLHLHPSISGIAVGPSALGKLFAEFPNLEHLVLDPITVGEISHPKVKWIDLWSLGTNAWDQAIQDTWGETYSKLNKTRFPSLEGKRTLPLSLVHLQDLPRDIPPDTVPSNRAPPLSFEYDGIHVRVEFEHIVLVSEREWDDEEDECGSYCDSSDCDPEGGDDNGRAIGEDGSKTKNDLEVASLDHDEIGDEDDDSEYEYEDDSEDEDWDGEGHRSAVNDGDESSEDDGFVSAEQLSDLWWG